MMLGNRRLRTKLALSSVSRIGRFLESIIRCSTKAKESREAPKPQSGSATSLPRLGPAKISLVASYAAGIASTITTLVRDRYQSNAYTLGYILKYTIYPSLEYTYVQDLLEGSKLSSLLCNLVIVDYVGDCSNMRYSTLRLGDIHRKSRVYSL
jgi:hypothetical protein